MNKRIRKKHDGERGIYALWSFNAFVSMRGRGVERIVRREYIRRRNRLRPCSIGVQIPSPVPSPFPLQQSDQASRNSGL